MARIALIKCSIPPSANMRITPPLGVLYLSASLLEKGHQVKAIDFRLNPKRTAWISDELREFQPDIVGLSACTAEAGSMSRLAELARTLPSVQQVVCGGPHATAFSRDVLADAGVDCVVKGEGEETFLELVETLESGGRVDSVRGIAWKDGGEIRENGPRPFIPDLDSIPFPAWHLIDLERYYRVPRSGTLKRRRYAPIITSRGCPYGCIFCHGLFGRKIRFRSIDNVLAEMEFFRGRYGINEFQIDDDCFNVHRKRVEEFCDRVKERFDHSRFVFPNGVRGDLLDREILLKLKSIGTYYMAIAVETASPRLQKLIGKNLDLQKVRAAIAECRRLKILTLGFVMFGFPTETWEEAKMSADWAITSKLDIIAFFLLNPFGETEMFRRYIQPKVANGWSDKGKTYSYYGTNINVSEIPDADLIALFRKSYRRFYFRRIPLILFGPALRNVSLFQGIKSVLNRAYGTRD